MIYLTLLLTAIFLILSAIHIYWALGGEVGKAAAIPVKNDGQRSFSPSKTGTLAVAVALFCFAVLVLCIGVQSVTVLRPLGWLLALERRVPDLAHKGRSNTLKLEHNFTLN